MREKIEICYNIITTYAPICLVFASPHYTLKHLAILRPTHPTVLLWLVSETAGLNFVLAIHMLVHNYLALALAVTTPLSLPQALVVWCTCMQL